MARNRNQILGIGRKPPINESPQVEVVAGTAHQQDSAPSNARENWLVKAASAARTPGTSASGPVRAMQEALESSLGEQNAKFEALKAKVESGEVIIDLDPADIDPSFIKDRMDIADQEVDELADQIKERGQLVPILVRPHPEKNGRYQIAYGHRRLRAAAKLGIKVRATIRRLNDPELVLAQGQENNARLDLTFIEKARFACELETRGFEREVISGALSLKDSNLSVMISIASFIPAKIIDGIGKAPGIGRPRWSELLDILKDKEKLERALQLVDSDAFRACSSEQRFLFLLDEVKKSRTLTSVAKPVQARTFWVNPNGQKLASIKYANSKCTLQIDQRDDPDFATFLISKLDDVYREFQASKK